MIILYGTKTKTKDLDISGLRICKDCGSNNDNYEAFVEYNVFTLFFLPVFRWGRKYYLRSNCCSALFEIDPAVGKELENGRISTIDNEDLVQIGRGYNPTTCQHCGYEADANFPTCPSCGKNMR